MSAGTRATAWRALALAAACSAACGARAHGGASGGATAEHDAITLYRDVAVIEKRIDVDVPAAGSATVRAQLAAGVTLSDVQLVGDLELTFSPLRLAGSDAAAPGDAGVASGSGSDDAGTDALDGIADPGWALDAADPDASARAATAPITVETDVSATHAGHYKLELVSTTPLVTWSAAYTLVTAPARRTAAAHGALVIANGAGLPFPGARITVVDDTLHGRRDNLVTLLAPRPAATDPSSHPAQPHALGVVDVPDGEVRIELYPPGAERALRPVLLFDAVGTHLDNPSGAAVRDEDLGVRPPPSTHVTESLEVLRDPVADVGMPGGNGRLVEQRPDGSLVVLGEGRLFDASTRVAAYDALPLGIAQGVSGHRVRRDYEVDDERARLTEDFTIELDNERAQPVELVVREHMYRSANWAIGFSSVPADQDGTQAISLRTAVPAKSKASLLYVVVYWWEARK